MDPNSLVPSPDILPAPWWVFEGLGLVTFTLHLLFMNVVLGATLLGAWRALLGGKISSEGHGSPLRGSVPVSLALAVNFGVAPLLFVQVTYGHLMYTSSILMGSFWLLVVPAVILAYYGAYLSKELAPERPLARAATVTSALLLLYVAFIYVNNMTLMLQPASWLAYFENRDGTLLNLGDKTLWPRYLHMVVGAVAVTGLFAALRAAFLARRRSLPRPEAEIRAGLRLLGFATMLEVLLGLWFLMVLPREVMLLFMGRTVLGTATLTLGLVGSVALIVVAMRGKLAWSTGLLLVTMLVMVLQRWVVRQGYLADIVELEALPMSLAWSPLLVFLLVFVLGLGVVAWLLRVALATPASSEPAGVLEAGEEVGP